MSDKAKKIVMLNTLIFCFCIVVVALFCYVPKNNLKEKEVVDVYTISFNTDGGTSIATVEIEEGKTIAVPEEPTKEGYVFIGWMYNGEPYDFSHPIEGNITLTAEWKKLDDNKKYYVVAFNTDGGTTVPTQVLEEGQKVSKPSNPTKEGYEFVNWEVDGVEYKFTEDVTKDMVITAKYKEKEKPTTPDTPTTPPTPQTKSYQVSFNLAGGQAGGNCNNQNVKDGGKVNNVCRPTRAHFDFVGWDKDINMNITQATVFTAKWQEHSKYTVTFHANGGSGSCPVASRYVGETFNLNGSCNMTPPAHYSLGGWSTTSGSGNQAQASVSSNAAMNFNVYAVWKKLTYSVTATLSTDGTTAGGYLISVNNNPGGVTSVTICGNDRCQDAMPSMKINNNFIMKDDKLTCTIKFSDSDETFGCTVTKK